MSVSQDNQLQVEDILKNPLFINMVEMQTMVLMVMQEPLAENHHVHVILLTIMTIMTILILISLLTAGGVDGYAGAGLLVHQAAPLPTSLPTGAA